MSRRSTRFTRQGRTVASASVIGALVISALVISVLGGAPAQAASGPDAAAAASASQTAPPVAGVDPFPAGTTRIAGATRYETAAAAAAGYAPGGPVFVATGADFPDALSAASAAAALGGPLLLTRRTDLPTAVRERLHTLAPSHIYVVGGTGVITASAFDALREIAPVTRVSGADRYATSAAVTAEAFGTVDEVFLATGRTFPDALAAAGAAGSRGVPVVLVDGARTAVPAATVAALHALGAQTVSIVGGYGAVSAGIHGQLAQAGFAVDRYAGSGRYETAVAVSDAFFAAQSPAATLLATGTDFPDALAGAALAGALHAPLLLTSRTCLPSASRSALTMLDTASLVVLGGEGAVSAAAANGRGCRAEDLRAVDGDYATSDLAFSATAPLPYADRPPVTITDPGHRFDASGLRIYTRRDNRQQADHPVALAQWGISALLEYDRTSDAEWLRSAVRHGEQLIAMRTYRGDAWWFPYGFPWAYDQREMQPPWWSGMAQGQALSLFVRLSEATGEDRWEVAAERTWQSFEQARSTTAPWSTFVHDGLLIFEEYAGNEPPLLVLNGQIFALFGLYDYWRHTGDAAALEYLDAGATTVLEVMPLVRKPGGVSYYCFDAAYCQRPFWQNQTYHPIHSWQLDTLASLTGDSRFSDWAALLRADWTPLTKGFGEQHWVEPDPLLDLDR